MNGFRHAAICFAMFCCTTAFAVDQRDFHESTDHYRERVKDFERAAKDLDFIERQSLRIIGQLEDLSYDLERASTTDLNRSGELLVLISQQQVQVERAIFAAYSRQNLGNLPALWRQVCAAGQLMDGQYRMVRNLPLHEPERPVPYFPPQSPYDPYRPLVPVAPLVPISPILPGGTFNPPSPLYPTRVVLGYTGSLVPGVHLVIVSVSPGSLAEQMGLRRGDRVVGINGIMPQDEAGIASALGSRNGEVILDVSRDGQRIRLQGNAYQARRPSLDDPRMVDPGPAMALGAQPILLDIQAGVYRDGLGESLVIEHVDPRGLGARHGLRAGDRILAVNNRTVTNMEEFRAYAQLSAGGMSLSIDRPGIGPSTIAIRY